MSVNNGESVFYGPITATTGQFNLRGGLYMVEMHATSWGASATLSALGPDGSTFLPVGVSETSDGCYSIFLPAGQYQFTLSSGFTGFYGSVTHIPQG